MTEEKTSPEFADPDNAFLRHVRLDNLDHGNAALVGRGVLHNIKYMGSLLSV